MLRSDLVARQKPLWIALKGLYLPLHVEHLFLDMGQHVLGLLDDLRGRPDQQRIGLAGHLANIARAYGKDIEEMTVTVLDRPRHNVLIAEIRATGARLGRRSAYRGLDLRGLRFTNSMLIGQL